MKAAIDYSKIKHANQGQLMIKDGNSLKPIDMGELFYKKKRLFDLIAEYEQLKKLEKTVITKLKHKNYPLEDLREALKNAELTDYNKLQRIKKLKSKLKEIDL